VELLPSLRVYEPVAVATFVPLTVVSVPFSKKTWGELLVAVGELVLTLLDASRVIRLGWLVLDVTAAYDDEMRDSEMRVELCG
jgi:hypothetical protein